jgi:hypothetical protein
MLRLCKVASKKVRAGYEIRHRLIAQGASTYTRTGTLVPHPIKGVNMRSGITQFIAIGIALVGATAIASAVAYSAVEPTRVIAHVTKPVPKAEFRLSDHQPLRKIFLSQETGARP